MRDRRTKSGRSSRLRERAFYRRSALIISGFVSYTGWFKAGDVRRNIPLVGDRARSMIEEVERLLEPLGRATRPLTFSLRLTFRTFVSSHPRLALALESPRPNFRNRSFRQWSENVPRSTIASGLMRVALIYSRSIKIHGAFKGCAAETRDQRERERERETEGDESAGTRTRTCAHRR